MKDITLLNLVNFRDSIETLLLSDTAKRVIYSEQSKELIGNLSRRKTRNMIDKVNYLRYLSSINYPDSFKIVSSTFTEYSSSYILDIADIVDKIENLPKNKS